jgi:hypothetical protein
VYPSRTRELLAYTTTRAADDFPGAPQPACTSRNLSPRPVPKLRRYAGQAEPVMRARAAVIGRAVASRAVVPATNPAGWLDFLAADDVPGFGATSSSCRVMATAGASQRQT